MPVFITPMPTGISIRSVMIGAVGIGVMKTGITIGMGIAIAVEKVGISLRISSSLSSRLSFSRSLAKIVISTIGSVVGAIDVGVVKSRVNTGVTIAIGAVEESGVSLSLSLGFSLSRSLQHLWLWLPQCLLWTSPPLRLWLLLQTL